jgi:hypothetical protein
VKTTHNFTKVCFPLYFVLNIVSLNTLVPILQCLYLTLNKLFYFLCQVWKQAYLFPHFTMTFILPQVHITET